MKRAVAMLLFSLGLFFFAAEAGFSFQSGTVQSGTVQSGTVQFAPSLEGAEGAEQSVAASVTLFCGNMSEPYPHSNKAAAGGTLSYTLDAKTLFAAFYFSLSTHTTDITAQAVYWPLWTARLNAGLGAVAHFKACEDAFNETDVLLGGWIRRRGNSHGLGRFEFNANVAYMIKASRIHAIDSYINRLTNNSIALGVECKYHIAPWRAAVWAGLSSWSMTSFMLFFAPRWTAGFEWEMLPSRYIGLEVTAVYIDQATLSAYCEGAEIKCFARWSAKH